MKPARVGPSAGTRGSGSRRGLGTLFPVRLTQALHAPELVSRPAGVAPSHPGTGGGKWPGAPPGWRRSASPPLHLAPSRPRGNSRHPHPGRPDRRELGGGAGQALPPTSSSWNLDAALRGGEPGAGRPGPWGGSPGLEAPDPKPLLVPGERHIPGPRGEAGPSRAGREESSALGEGE